MQVIDFERGEMIPVYYVQSAGGDGVLQILKRPVGLMAVPDGLRYSHHAFGIECLGDYMSPAFERRDVVICNPDREPVPGDDVVLVRGFSVGDTSPFEGILRRLVAESEGHWHVQQFNPERKYRLSKLDWPRALHVAGKKSR